MVDEDLGRIPQDDPDSAYYGTIALDDQRAWFGKYRLSDGDTELYLGAPQGHYVADLAPSGDRIAWVTVESARPIGGGTSSQLFIADANATLE